MKEYFVWMDEHIDMMSFICGEIDKDQLLKSWTLNHSLCSATDMHEDDKFFVLDESTLRFEADNVVCKIKTDTDNFEKGETVIISSCLRSYSEDQVFSWEGSEILLGFKTVIFYGVKSIEVDFIRRNGCYYELISWSNPFKFFTTLIQEIEKGLSLFSHTKIKKIRIPGTSDKRTKVYAKIAKKLGFEMEGFYLILKN